jgi:hypothetical protein
MKVPFFKNFEKIREFVVPLSILEIVKVSRQTFIISPKLPVAYIWDPFPLRE